MSLVSYQAPLLLNNIVQCQRVLGPILFPFFLTHICRKYFVERWIVKCLGDKKEKRFGLENTNSSWNSRRLASATWSKDETTLLFWRNILENCLVDKV